MATIATKQYGITAPLSSALPTEDEVKLTDALKAELRRQDNFESAEETQKREIVLKSLEKISEEFVKKALKKEKLPEHVVNAAGCKIMTFGSYRLGVFGPGSDIDTLVVVPRQVTLDRFFEIFPTLLVEMAPEGTIQDLTIVKEAFVPIIGFKYMGINIDLLFGRIDCLSQIHKNLDLTDNSLLRGLGETELRCLNGTRVTDEILQLVPQPPVFRMALRAIKLWAQRRAIYANIVGFPGGVAWAMLVARVCQLYPRATASTVVFKFFKIIGSWSWPQPVLLKTIEPGTLPVKQWNPKLYKQDSYNLMPIITPAYPSMCATFNVTHSNKAVIQKELDRGGRIAENILGKKSDWKELFDKHTFFTEDYKYYLGINAASTTKEAHTVWGGTVESKVRHLVGNLDYNDSVALAHPFNKGVERVHKCNSQEQIEKVKSGSHDFVVKEEKKDLTETSKENGVNGDQKPSSDDNTTMVYTSTFYIGLKLAEGTKKLDLSWETTQFIDMCKQQSKFDSALHSLNVTTIRAWELPDDVFSPGEKKRDKKSCKNHMKRLSDEEPNGTPRVKRSRQAPQTTVAAKG